MSTRGASPKDRHAGAGAKSRPWKRPTIAGKLLGWFLVISMVPLIALLVLTQELTLSLMRETALSHLQTLADHKSHQIEAYAIDRKRDIAALVQLPLVGNAIEDLRHAFRSKKAGAVERSDAVFRPQLTAFSSFAGYDDLLLISIDGEVLFSSSRRFPAGTALDQPPLAGTEMSKAVARARAQRVPQLSGFDPQSAPGAPATYIATPVLHDSQLIGIAVVQLSNRELWEAVTDFNGLGSTGEVVLGMLQADGIIMVAPMRHDPEAAFHRKMALSGSLGMPLSQAVSGNQGAGEALDYRGIPSLAVWRYLPSFQWGMVVKIDRDEALALVIKQRQLVLVIALLTLAGVGVLALVAARSLSRPVDRLTKVVRRMSAGDLNHRVEVETGDELGELAHAFNHMTNDLKGVYATIEEQVRQRTFELKGSNRALALARDDLRKFYQAVECSPVSVLITNPEGLIEYVNPHFTTITGYSADEVIGRNPSVVSSRQTPRATYDALWATIQSGDQWHGEFLNRRKNGELYWEAASVSPVRHLGGEITHFVAIEDDISARKHDEEQLVFAKNAAEAANRTKSEFLAVMSHEIRTPMNGILGMTRLMLDSPLSGQQRDYLDTIRQSGEALLALLNDILDFSKLEAGRVDLETVDFDLPATIASVTALMSARAGEKGLTLKTEIAADVPRYLVGDPARLRQILLNLIGNAVKFTENGSVKLLVEALTVGAKSTTFRFSVVDTGIGIPEEVRARLFESFSQADSSITRRYGGSGLGLAICRRLVGLHGGDIGVDSTLARGSRFWFTLAYAPGQEPDKAPSGGPSMTSALPRMRILLAEDNGVNRKVATALLEKWGHRVTAVNDGVQAVSAAAAEPFDLVLMDMQMPEMDGLDATRSIRALPGAASEVPIIALTANAMREDEMRCLEAGMDDYVSKPIEPDRLFAALERVYQRRMATVR
jgi:PAS domain S-box-containing protein